MCILCYLACYVVSHAELRVARHDVYSGMLCGVTYCVMCILCYLACYVVRHAELRVARHDVYSGMLCDVDCCVVLHIV